MVVTVHYHEDVAAKSNLLDIVEVPRSHSGVNLGEVLLQILRDFNIEHKVSGCRFSGDNVLTYVHHLFSDSIHHLGQRLVQRCHDRVA